MRPQGPGEVGPLTEQHKAVLDADHHVEPRNIDTWHAAEKVGSFMCRRCGLPAFPALASRLR